MGTKGKLDVINIEEIIKDYVWNKYKNSLGSFKRFFLCRKNYEFDIPWGYVDFQHVSKQAEEKQVGETSAGVISDNVITSTEKTNKSTDEVSSNEHKTVVVSKLTDKVDQTDDLRKKNIELYFSEYENKTDISQKYKFTASRETTSSTKFEFQENYTLGAETNLEINLAEILKIGAKVSGSYSVTKTEGETFTKAFTWNIDSEIDVPSWHKAKASLYVYEIPTKTKFVVETTLSLPTARFPIRIRRVKDKKEIYILVITNLATPFRKHIEGNNIINIRERKTCENGMDRTEEDVVLKTLGVCRNVSFLNQHVKVECQEIKRPPNMVKHVDESVQTDFQEDVLKQSPTRIKADDINQANNSMCSEPPSNNEDELVKAAKEIKTDLKVKVEDSKTLKSTVSNVSESEIFQRQSLAEENVHFAGYMESSASAGKELKKAPMKIVTDEDSMISELAYTEGDGESKMQMTKM